MKLDQAGEDLIKEFESLSLVPYLDEGGIPTIGWGHIDNVTMDSPPITQDQAEDLFQQDLAPVENAANKYVVIAVNQNQFNALVSIAFNEGIGILISSTLARRLNLGDFQGAAKEFARWKWVRDKKTGLEKISDGLVRRRALEAAIFLAPIV